MTSRQAEKQIRSGLLCPRCGGRVWETEVIITMEQAVENGTPDGGDYVQDDAYLISAHCRACGYPLFDRAARIGVAIAAILEEE